MSIWESQSLPNSAKDMTPPRAYATIEVGLDLFPKCCWTVVLKHSYV